VCQLSIQNASNKNPSNDKGETPMHYAAKKGFLNICQLIVENAKNINTADHDGDTPLTLAAQGGHLEICKLIIENETGENLAHNFRVFDDFGSDKDYFDTVKFIVQSIKEKQFSDPIGMTQRQIKIFKKSYNDHCIYVKESCHYDHCIYVDNVCCSFERFTVFENVVMHGNLEDFEFIIENVNEKSLPNPEALFYMVRKKIISDLYKDVFVNQEIFPFFEDFCKKNEITYKKIYT